jgi:hypothetical protein
MSESGRSGSLRDVRQFSQGTVAQGRGGRMGKITTTVYAPSTLVRSGVEHTGRGLTLFIECMLNCQY